MGEQNNPSEKIMESPVGWQVTYQLGVCEQCDWRFLIPEVTSEALCPHCFHAKLTLLGGSTGDLSEPQTPELFLPFSFSEARLSQSLNSFSGGLWFPPGDLNSSRLMARLRRLYLPMWLVDSTVKANWQAEAGFKYQVVSHQDRYDDSRAGWTTREVTETRVRWEPRLGRLNRTYKNIASPALQQHRLMMAKLGGFDLTHTQAYVPDQVFGSIHPVVGLPDRSTVDAWQDTSPGFQTAASEECRQACGADHLREFRWSPTFNAQNWTLLLLPALTTYYQDDEGHLQVVWINGQSGTLSGVRRASLKRARNTTLWILGCGVIFFILSLILSAFSALVPLFLVLGGVGLLLSLMLGLASLIPLLIAWWVNRNPREFRS